LPGRCGIWGCELCSRAIDTVRDYDCDDDRDSSDYCQGDYSSSYDIDDDLCDDYDCDIEYEVFDDYGCDMVHDDFAFFNK